MNKPTPRQMKIVEAMRAGSSLILCHGLDPWAHLIPSVKGLKIRNDDPYHLERRGIVKPQRKERLTFTEYVLTEEWK